MTNLLIAIKNIIENPITDLVGHYTGSNRINSMGDALETYVKDLFASSLITDGMGVKNEKYQKVFSYIGNQNNPPDTMIRKGDAIEVKKIESARSGIALNSSYPKDKLYADSPMLTQACKEAENWKEKDIIYVIGVAKNKKLTKLWFVYGDCYAAGKDTYERIKNKITSGLEELRGVELSATKELGRINKVDPLGITRFRIRGMWHIDNPVKVFNYLDNLSKDSDFTVNALMLESKYQSFPEKDRKAVEKIINEDFKINSVKIKSPNNPAKLLDAKLISFQK